MSTSPCATIQYAHNVANPADVIDAAQGVYAESVTINRRVKLRGAGKGLTVIRGGIVVGVTMLASSMDVEVEGLSVRPAGSNTDGLVINSGAPVAYGVRNVDIQGFANHGINVNNSSGGSVSIALSEISLNGGDGIHMDNPSVVVIGDIELDGNQGDGLQFTTVSASSISVVRTKARFSGEAGFQVENMTGGTVTMRDSCALSNGSQAGILMNNLSGGQILIERSNIARNASGGAHVTSSSLGAFFDPDLRNNWWGDASGPSGVGPGSGNTVSAQIRFSPFSAVPFVFSTPPCQ